MSVNIPTPQRANNKLEGEFYPLQKEELLALRKAKLINNTAFVHLALRYENPFCDRPVEVIPKEFSLKWNIPESSVYKAIAQLKKLGLIFIKSGKLIIEWISKSEEKISEPDTIITPETKLSDPAKDSQIRQKIIRSENQLSDPAKKSQIWQNRSSETLSELDSNFPQTSQTNQTSSYVSNYETHTQNKILQDKQKKNSQEAFNEFALDPEKITDAIAQSINQQEEEFFRSCSIEEIEGGQKDEQIYPQEDKLNSKSTKGFGTQRSRTKGEGSNDQGQKLSRTQSINWQWLPEGVWNINGKLDPAFQEWLAKKWLAKYDDIADIYEAKANVLAYFHNNPQKLPIRWEEYQAQFIAKGENLKTRMEHGCQIKEREKQEFCDRLSALKPLDDSQSVSANQAIPASNLVLNQYQQLIEGDTKEQNADVEIVIDENDVIVETKQSSANIYTEDEYGAKVRNKDFTGCHQQEQIPVNKNAINAIAEWLKAKKGGRK